jgi:hypothetical protein
MEDNSQGSQGSVVTAESVGFPQQTQAPENGKAKWVILLVIIVLVVAGGGYFLLKGANEVEEPLATPEVQGIDFVSTPTPETTPVSTSTPTPANKADIEITVLNGTGAPGDAGFLQTQLKSLGFSKTETGNATTQGATTTMVTYSSSISKTIIDELSAKLKTLYTKVELKTGTPTKGDIEIVTGTRKGVAAATTKPSGTPSGSSTPKPSASTSPTPSAAP